MCSSPERVSGSGIVPKGRPGRSSVIKTCRAAWYEITFGLNDDTEAMFTSRRRLVEPAVVLAEPVADAARPVGVVQRAVVRQPAQVVDQREQLGDPVASGLGRGAG
jgi:hypothetical protein